MAISKPAMDALSQSLAATLQPGIQSAFRDIFANVVVPAFERSTQNLYASVATTFNKGCKDYEGHLKHHVAKQV